jgi:DNA anti-recombination protein RmuC
MRARLVLLLVAILLVAGFAALNSAEIMRPTTLSFGVATATAPLGAILLGLLAVALLVFLASSAAANVRMRTTENRYHRELQVQRDLAEREEASRFTQLRQHFDNHLRESRQRDAVASTEFEKSMLQSHRDLRNQLEQIHHTLATRLGELESRTDARLERPDPAVDVTHRQVNVEDVSARDRVKV